MLRLVHARSNLSQAARAGRIARPTPAANSAAPSVSSATPAAATAVAARSSRRAFSSAATPKDGSTPATPIPAAAASSSSAAKADPASSSATAKSDPAATSVDSLPDLASFPPDEDPAVTAKRLLLSEEISRDANRRGLYRHWAALAAILGLGVAYKVYRHYSYGDAVLSNPLKVPARRAAPTFDPNPAAEDSPLWELMRQMHPGVEPIPELKEQWERTRREKARRLAWDASPEGIAHWEKNKTKADWERMQCGYLQTFEVEPPHVTLTEEQRNRIREAAKARSF